MSMWFGCRMPLFLNFSYFITYINSFNHIHTIHLSVAICRGGASFLVALSAQWEKPPYGAEIYM